MLSPVRLSSVCLSVTRVRSSQAVELIGYFSTSFGTPKILPEIIPGELNSNVLTHLFGALP